MALIPKRDRPVFAGAEYLGGLTKGPRRSMGHLSFDDTVSLGAAWQKVEIPVTDIASIATTSEMVGKRKTGAVLMFGVLGLAGKGSKTEGSISISLKSGEEAYFMIPKLTNVKIKAALAGWMTKFDIPWSGERDEDGDGNGGAPTSKADELAKLAQLHAAGTLTDQEFAAAKADLLGLDD